MAQTVVDAMDTVLSGGGVPQFILTPSVIVDSTNLDAYIAGDTWTEPVPGFAEIDNGQPTVSQ
jgi:hypothetical protein